MGTHASQANVAHIAMEDELLVKFLQDFLVQKVTLKYT
jgi:hypothetical protein